MIAHSRPGFLISACFAVALEMPSTGCKTSTLRFTSRRRLHLSRILDDLLGWIALSAPTVIGIVIAVDRV